MDFTPRTQQILEILLGGKGPVSKQEIADHLGVSKRTIQREFGFLENDIKKYGLGLVNRKGKGIVISGELQNIEKLRREIEQNSGAEAATRDERRRHLLFELLRDREPRKLFYYSEMLGVSETTVASDMEALGEWFSRNNLEVLRRPGYGVVLGGTEGDYREAMRRFIHESEWQKSEKRFTGGSRRSRNAEEAVTDILLNAADSGIYSLLNNDILTRVYNVLSNMDEPMLHQLADNAMTGLAIHIAIAIDRVQKGAVLEANEKGLEDLASWEGYDLAVKILREMEAEFEITIPGVELSYILLHLRGSKIAYSGTAGDKKSGDDVIMRQMRGIDEEKLLDMIDEMIEIFNPSISYELKCDEDFVRGLLVHLRPVIVRLLNHMNIFNPILKDIREEYPDVFQRCAQASKVIERETHEQVREEEIGFLAMHFGAAEERILERQKAARRVVIGVICASGFGVARLMLTKLSNHLGDRATFRAYGKDEITPGVIEDTDFFVSTLNLDSLGIDCVRVSPLITASDLSQIEYRIKGYGQVRRRRQDTDFVRQMDEVGVIAGDLSSLIRKYRHYEISPNVNFRELLRVLSMQLTDSLAAAAKVISAVTERERLNSQIFPEMGFCLLHCRTDAVSETVFISCSPRGDDHFKDPYLKGIRAAVMMLMPIDDHRRIHADVLGRISSAFIKNEVFLKAVQDGSEDNVRTELTHELRTFFSEYVEKL
ncbi:MAG: BglG family transcription antiterminator [Lachnospiraceae bacterium]|nr:BglG family transcription antiterminator [Lachnospiraceae bacterium]